MRAEPWVEEERYQIQLERRHKKYLQGCPECVICGKLIDEPRCYVLEPDDKMNSCICKDCMEKQQSRMRKTGIERMILEWLEEQLDYCGFEMETPHDERWYA